MVVRELTPTTRPTHDEGAGEEEDEKYEGDDGCGGCDAVCLQELDPTVLAAVRAAALSRGWHVHACGFAEVAGGGSAGAASTKTCHAITCIVAPR